MLLAFVLTLSCLMVLIAGEKGDILSLYLTRAKIWHYGMMNRKW